MHEPVLELYNLTKAYGPRLAVNDVTLTVNAGEVYGIIGINGAGKTTTIKMIVGLASPTSGEIKICGYSLKRDFEKAVGQVGGIIENPELYSYLTGRQNLSLFAKLYKGIDKNRVNEVIRLVGLESRIDDRVKKYSLGMRQRLGIAQSLLHKPRLLILDEPTNGLDPSGIHEMRDLLRKLAASEGVAVFISSHILSEMQLICDRAAIIDNGKIIRVLSIEELVTGGNRYLIKTNDGEAAALVLKKEFGEREILTSGAQIRAELSEEEASKAIAALIKEGITVYWFKPIGTDLESTFLAATRASRIN